MALQQNQLQYTPLMDGPVIKQTRNRRTTKKTAPKRAGIKASGMKAPGMKATGLKATGMKASGLKASLRFPKQRAMSSVAASGPARPPKPPDHHKFAPWADVPPTDKVRKFADEIFGDIEMSAPKRKH